MLAMMMLTLIQAMARTETPSFLWHPFVYSDAVLTYDSVSGQFPHFSSCMGGPQCCILPCGCYGRFDMDGDCDVDLRDWAVIERMHDPDYILDEYQACVMTP
jgi:hypothetical protein